MSNPKISVAVTPEQETQLKLEANAKGKSLSDHVRDQLFPGEAGATGSVLLEDAPPTAVPVPLAPVRPEALKVLPVVPHGRHACLHLRPLVFAQNYGPKDSQGTCGHQEQRGRPCFWASTVAKNCQKFEAYRFGRSAR